MPWMPWMPWMKADQTLMNQENPRYPPNPRNYFCGSEDAQQRFSKRVPTSSCGL
jgi:hypothetical protein